MSSAYLCGKCWKTQSELGRCTNCGSERVALTSTITPVQPIEWARPDVPEDFNFQVWSCGGGTQSAAIGALICQGRLPKPDIALIADTEREKRATWDYMDSVLVPNLRQAGVEIIRVPKSLYKTDADPDVWTDWDNSENGTGVLMPVFSLGVNGEVSRIDSFCSSRWKRRIIQRWLRTHGVTACTTWLGMSLDEMQRVRASREGWYQHRWPLIFDVPMSRGDCIRLVMDTMGWPEPPRSSCWMCPNHDDKEWRRMKEEAPDDFLLAVRFEQNMQRLRPDFYLHRSCLPLDQVQFDSGQMNLLAACDSGYCFV